MKGYDGMLQLKLTGDIAGFAEGLKLTLPLLPIRLTDGGIPVKVERGDRLTAALTEKEGLIRWSKKAEFFRALSLIAQNGVGCSVTENRTFDHSGVLLDLTNNNVQKPGSLGMLFARMALMGLDTVFIQQIMQVEDYPRHGYLRDAYSYDELKAIDDMAYSLGIEAVPFVNTLNELMRDLWWDNWCPLLDVTGVALVGNEKTNRYLEAVVKAATAPYRTKRIHLGIYPAQGVGLGRYLRDNGYRTVPEIIREHVGYMGEILDKLGLHGVMWADVYLMPEVSEEIKQSAPASIELIYRAQNACANDLASLQKLPAHMMYAAEGCTNFGPAPRYDLTVAPMAESLKTCRENGVKDAFIYFKGDDGAECSLFTALYQMQVLAEVDYTGSYDKIAVKSRFAACASGDADAFLGLDGFNVIGDCTGSPCKFLLYEDPLTLLFEKDCEGREFSKAYAALEEKCTAWREQNPVYAQMFDFYAKLAAALQRKCAWQEQAGKIVRAKDRAAAKALAASAPSAVYALRALKDAWRSLWYATRKTSGFEVIDLRLGALVQRMESAGRRMALFADGKVDDIEELSAERLPLATYKDGRIGMVLRWKDITTPSSLIM